MHRNPIWLLFLVCVTFVTVWFCFQAGGKLYRYMRLTTHAQADVEEWTVEKGKNSHYFLTARYRYDVKGSQYIGSSSLVSHPFRNSWSAQDAIPRATAAQWSVWYSPAHPERSVIEKKFPMKECLSAGVLLALIVYFIFLGFYVKKKVT
ncbi:DUF3592 domain-containing protein [Simkania negevensis]|uniref:DUF3592 domain-containing protein n=1 Tax=Simkania negevensis TaxID=83561 RepID=A0ABS3AW82_9BACT|nr:DUF3592 domain-containing protein [Simkania negevensis]